MKLVDSKSKKLSMQEIIIHASERDKDNAPMPLAGIIMSIMEELRLPNSEARQFGNTLFISHFSADKKMCIMRALNMDTPRNFINNGELYTRHLIKMGTVYFYTIYTNESFGLPFRQIEKHKLGRVLTGKTVYGDFETHVLLNTPKNKEQQDAAA